jgi:glycosyltransferase involved in cell wall biosynthesis
MVTVTAAQAVEGKPLRRLLYMSELPPSTLAGLPLIARRLLEDYDPERLQVLCCEHEHRSAGELARASYLPCAHTTVRRVRWPGLRPRRIFGPIRESVNALRIPAIAARARELIERDGIEAILTVPWRCEFALAAYRASKQTGLPLYVFEMDDWEAMNPHLLHGRLVRRFHGKLLRHAERLWLISPAMVRRYERQFGVRGDFLFHFVDVDLYTRASARREPFDDPGEVRLVYTGSVNQMFYDALKGVAEALNAGLSVRGRRVTLTMYGDSCPPELLGSGVRFEGFVPSEQIPEVLAAADVLLLGVSFSQDPELLDLVQTSIYTKTVDYLAANRPVLLVSPRYSAEVEYFGEVTTVVDSPDAESVRAALAAMLDDPEQRVRRSRQGLQLVRERHSIEMKADAFLNAFRRAPEAEGSEARSLSEGTPGPLKANDRS